MGLPSDAFGIGGSYSPDSWHIELNIPDIPLFVPDKARAELNAIVARTVKLALQMAAGMISREAPVDTGGLAQSFGADPATRTGGIELLGDASDGVLGRVFSSLPYAIVMEEGRRPGSPISRDGIDAIGKWAERKLGLSAEQADRAKWAIAANIVAQGFQGTEYFTRGVEAARPRIEEMFAILGDEMAKALVGG